MMSTLSFVNDNHHDEALLDEEQQQQPAACNLKNPSVDTSVLPDKKREEEQDQKRRRLEQAWKKEQEEMKNQDLEIVYSYWDGSGHRRTVRVKKGATIGQFLELVRKDLCKEFREMQAISSDALLYVKEDLILPQDITFYDLIATRARGKSGPLFHFDAHDDVCALERLIFVWKRMKPIQERWWNGNGTIATSTFFQPVDGNSTIPPKNTARTLYTAIVETRSRNSSRKTSSRKNVQVR